MEVYFDLGVKVLAGLLVLYTFREKFYTPVDRLVRKKIVQPHIDLNKRCDDFDSKCKEIDSQITVLMHGQKAILHDRIYGMCLYHLDAGWISLEDLENLSILYKSYTDLNGNGLCEKYYLEVCELGHTKIDKVEKEV